MFFRFIKLEPITKIIAMPTFAFSYHDAMNIDNSIKSKRQNKMR